MEIVYLDNNATTRQASEVIAAMAPFMEELYGNPSSVHRMGQRARQAVNDARAQVAELLHCSDAELTFTGCGTESVNTAIRGILQSRGGRRKIVTSTVEHSASRELCTQLAREGVEIIEIGVDQAGALDVDQLRSVVDDSVALVSIMWANNETGVILPVHSIDEICRGAKVPFHCDATQAVGKIDVDLRALRVDALSCAAHKFHGPKGVGVLFLRRGARMRPLLIGGPQERGRRGGTENVAGIVGTGVAAKLAGEHLADMPAVEKLRNHFESQVLSSIHESHINGDRSNRVPNTANIGFARLEAEAILLLLSERGICASAGSACSSGSLEPSHVLRAMKIDERIAHGSVRFSLSRYTTELELGTALTVLPPIIKKLRAVMPTG